MAARISARRPGRLLCLALVLVFFEAVSGCRPPPDPYRLTGFAFGSTYSVTLDETDPATQGISAALDSELRGFLNHLERTMNNWRPESDVSRFNAFHSTKPFPISDVTQSAVALSLSAARETDGAFDPALGSVLRLWGLGPDPFRGAPNAAMIEKARADSGWEKITLTRNSIQKSNPDLILQLDGMAQGFAVDRTVELLKGKGLRRFVVEIGGEIRAESGQGPAWTIPIQRPKDEPGIARLPALRLSNLSVTASARRNIYVQDGSVRYHHIIDPRTGRPTDNGIALAVVVGPEAGMADALDTALLVMPPNKGLQTVKRLGYDCLLVKPDGSMLTTPGFDALAAPTR